MRNAYEQRKAQRQLQRKIRSDGQRVVKMQEILARCQRHEQAYHALYERKCNVLYSKGWYWAHKTRYRADELDKLTRWLEVTKHMQDNPQLELCHDS